jgi:uncharacterized tellurite resistance protein B-like protein
MRLLDRIKEHLHGQAVLAKDGAGAPADIELRAATAILLLEAAYGDTEYLWREHRAIVKALERDFGLGKREILDLLGRANEIRPPVVKLADVTEVIRERYSEEQRQEIVRLIWRVIETDGELAEWEQSFAEHVAGAVCLSHAAARAARESA